MLVSCTPPCTPRKETLSPENGSGVRDSEGGLPQRARRSAWLVSVTTIPIAGYLPQPSCTTRTEQWARCATLSLTLPMALRPCRPREPTTTRLAPRERPTRASTGSAASQLSTRPVHWPSAPASRRSSLQTTSTVAPTRLASSSAVASAASAGAEPSRPTTMRRGCHAPCPCGPARVTEQEPSCTSSLVGVSEARCRESDCCAARRARGALRLPRRALAAERQGVFP